MVKKTHINKKITKKYKIRNLPKLSNGCHAIDVISRVFPPF